MDYIPGGADTTQGGGFDPRQAAALLDQTTQQARRGFATPAYTAAVYLPGGRRAGRVRRPLALGARPAPVHRAHQRLGHRRHGRAVATIIGWTAWVIGRAGTGHKGPAQRNVAGRRGQPSWRAAWITGYATTVPLYHAGASHPVWGLYPASAPLLIIYLGQRKLSRRPSGTGRRPVARLAIAVAAAAAGPGGPASYSWLITGIGPGAGVPGHRRVHRLAAAPRHGAAMTTRAGPADPRAHPAEDRRDAGGAARRDALSFTRPQDTLGLATSAT